uniref:Solute carrier family 10 member 1 n=1 Tax=Strix occidentalis caurina TaxID=311401 RepID=A0A8D0FKD7_STROC
LSLSPAMSPFSHVAPPFAFIQQAMDKVLNVILIVVLFIIMVSLGCTMEIAKITTHLRKRKGMALAVMAQYGIMPLTAFILAKLFQLGATESLACPSTEGFFLHLSIVMTTCSTVWTNASEGDLEGKVPYKGTVTSLVLMLIPCVISIILNEKKPHYTGFIIKAGMVVILLSSAAIIVLPVANVGSVFQLDDRYCAWKPTARTYSFAQLSSRSPSPQKSYFFPLLYLLFQMFLIAIYYLYCQRSSDFQSPMLKRTGILQKL